MAQSHKKKKTKNVAYLLRGHIIQIAIYQLHDHRPMKAC